MCQVHEYRKKTFDIYSIYNFAIKWLSISVDVPHDTTKQSNQQSARKGVKGNISRQKFTFQ